MAQENISVQLNDLLTSRDFRAELLDREGRPTDAENADIFTFDYVSSSGKDYGTMVIILDTENEMQVFYGDNLGRSMEGNDKNEFFDFVQHLHKFANMRRWTYSPKNINQVKYTMQGLAAIKEGLCEGYYGTRKVSYSGEPTQARLVIQHNRPLGETDARYRYVESLFIETADSQRFKLQFKNLTGARAMLEHVRQGGFPYDVRGSHITETVNEIATLSRFNRASAGRVLEGITAELVTEAQTYYKRLRENMKRMASPRGYNAYFETWHPATIDEQQELVEDIKTLFIEQTLDTRIEAALPLLARIQQQGNAMKEAQIFENWINNLAEGTWSLPETPEQLSKLKELMATELIVGPDATNATEQLYDLIGDDVLFDRLSELADRDPRANVWNDTEVMDRIRELGIETETQAPAGAEGDAAPVDSAATPAPAPTPQQPVAEELNAMRKAAGIPVAESRVLDEAGETIDHILNRFKHEVGQFEQGNDLDSDLYDALFDYYSDKGEIPYGIAKARTGDPFSWVSDKLANHLGVNEGWKGAIAGGLAGGALGSVVPALGTLAGAAAGAYAGHKLGDQGFKDPDAEYKKAQKLKQTQQLPVDEADAISTFEVMSGFDAPVAEGSCNMTAEGAYCPEHGLAECGGSMYESRKGDAVLARIKSLALLK